MKSTGRVILGIACASIGIGIAILFFGALFGGGREKSRYNTFTFNNEVEGVTSIDLDVDFGRVKVIEGDKFSVEVRNTTENGFLSEVKNGVWYLEDNFDDRYALNFFGLRLPIHVTGFGNNSDDYYPTVTIMIPEGFVAEEFDIDFGAGELIADKIDAKSVEFSIGAGEMTIKNMTVEKRSSFTVGAGSLKLNRLSAYDVTMECGVGEISVEGEILGDSSIDCGVGDVSLDLQGQEENYNYIVDCGIGSVKINSREWDFSTHESIRNDNATATFELDCGVGSINLRIR